MKQNGIQNLEKRSWKRGLAWALALSLAGAGTACASPADDLDEILARQAENMPASEAEKYLGMEALSEKAGERGFSFEAEMGLLDTVAEWEDFPEDIVRDGYVTVDFRNDKALREWLLELGLGMGEEPMLDISAYGDTEELALSIPQFFAGALGIRSGSFREQYAGSALEELLEEELPEGVDVNLVFYPDSSILGMSQEEFLEDFVGEEWEALKDSRHVEVSGLGNRSVYRASYETAALIRLYKAFFEEYFGIFVFAGFVTDEDVSSALEELEDTLDEIQFAMEDEICIEYYVADGNVTGIECFLELDLNRANGWTEEISEGTELSRETEEISEGAGLFRETEESSDMGPGPQYDPMNKAAIRLTLEFTDPQDLSQGWRLQAVGWDGSWEEQFWMMLRQCQEKKGTVAETSLDLILESEGQEAYNGELYHYSLDTQSGAFAFGMEWKDSDSEEDFLVTLKGSFQDVEPGERFSFLLEECSLSDGEETLGFDGLVRYAAEPGTIAKPQDTELVCEMSSGGLMGLLVEIQTNAEEWAEKCEAVLETETEYGGNEYSMESGDDSSENDYAG